MNWKAVVGRILSFVGAGFLLVFAVLGQVPAWWVPALAIVVPIVNILIGTWKPPE